MEFFLQAEAAVWRLPGVLKLGISDSLPPGAVSGDWIYNNIAVEGQHRSTNGTGGTVAYSWVTRTTSAPWIFLSFAAKSSQR